MGDPHYYLPTFLIPVSWRILSTYFMKTDSCALGIGQNLAWHGLASGCISISTGLVLQVTNVTQKMSSYLLNKLWSIALSSYGKCSIYDTTLRGSEFFYTVSSMQRVRQVASITG